MAKIWKRVLKLTIEAFCYSFFLFQFYDTIKIYLKYQTVTRLDYVVLKEMPSVTICFPRMYPKKGVEELRNQILKNASEEVENYFNITFVKNEFTYCNKFNACNPENVIENSLSYFNNSLMAKISSSLNKFTRFKNQETILDYQKFQNSNFDKNFQIEYFADYLDLNLKRCLSLFTEIDNERILKNVKKRKIEMNETNSLRIVFFDVFYKNDEVRLGVHARNQAPFAKSLLSSHVTGKKTLVSYHQTRIIALEPPFKTECRYYHLGIPEEDLSQFDCFGRCVFKQTLILADFQSYFLITRWWVQELVNQKSWNDLLVNSNFWLQDLQKMVLELKNVSLNDKLERMAECSSQCPIDCIWSKFDMTLSEDSETDSLKRFGRVDFDLKHDSCLDNLVEHSPLMDWVTFLGVF